MNSILIVDDNPDDREYMSRSLRRNMTFDHEVLEAQDETSCLEILQSGRKIDCILLDYSLPGQDGLKVLSHILDQDPSASVVMVSGQGSESVAVEALKRGALDYFVKSAYPPSEIEKSVLEAISRTSKARRIEDQRESLRSFADVMVHDLREPLRAVQGSVDALMRDLPAEISGTHAERMAVIRDGVAQIHRFLSVLQEYTAYDGSELGVENVDLNVQVGVVREVLKPELEAVNASLDCPEALPVIVGNGPKFAQLLEHLVRNGIQYNLSEEPVVRITARMHANHWSIDVTDNGIGIDPADHDRVFEPFWRLSSDGSYGGSGLGLAKARRIAQRLGCGLTCASLPGEGTTFTLTVPKSAPGASDSGRNRTGASLSATTGHFGGRSQ